MLFSSDEDDMPDVPTVEVGTPITFSLTSSNQAHRFRQLEELHREVQSGATPSRHKERRKNSSSTTAETTAEATAQSTSSAAPAVWCEQDEAAFYELRSLIPHLSPSFACSYCDAIHLIAAVRRGGGAASDQRSLAEKCQSLEADKRQLEQRLERMREECDTLHNDVAAAKQKLKAVQEESRGSVTVLSQRREEMRKQLLLEETRSEKLKVQNRKLQLENDALKERMRSQLR